MALASGGEESGLVELLKELLGRERNPLRNNKSPNLLISVLQTLDGMLTRILLIPVRRSIEDAFTLFLAILLLHRSHDLLARTAVITFYRNGLSLQSTEDVR